MRIVGSLYELNADIKDVLQDSFLSESEHWYPPAISLFLLIYEKRFQRDTEYLGRLMALYPNSSVIFSVGETQQPRIDDELVSAGISFKKNIHIFRWRRRASIFVSIVIWSALWYLVDKELGKRILNEPTISNDIKVFVSIVSIVAFILVIPYIIYTIYVYYKEKLLYYRIKYSLHEVKLEERDKEYIIEDLMKLI